MNMNDYDAHTLFRIIKKGKFSSRGCLEWQGPYDKNYYGVTAYIRKDDLNKLWKVHRLIWHLLKGKIDEEKFICHACDNPKCFNINHLFLGTPKENSIDRENKGRGKRILGEENSSSKITEKDVLLIRKMHSEGVRVCELTKIFNLLQPTVSKIVNRKRWKHI